MSAEGLADADLVHPSPGARRRQVHVVETSNRQDHHRQDGAQHEVHGVAIWADAVGHLCVKVDRFQRL